MTARPRITQAAINLAAQEGVGALTLDSVADKAGVSKGGLLYHFASKEALLAGLVEECLERWTADLTRRAQGDLEPGAAARAYIAAVADPVHDPTRELALLAATALDATTAALWRRAVDQWQAADDDRILDLLLVRLAADGLWLARALDLYGLDEERVENLRRRLTELASGAGT